MKRYCFFLGGGGGGRKTFPVEKTIPVDFRPEQPVLQMCANGKRSFPRGPRFQASSS